MERRRPAGPRDPAAAGGESKNGQGRTFAFEGELWAIIERRWSERVVRTARTTKIAPLVFHHDGHEIVDLKKAWATACTKAGVGKKLFHDFPPRFETCYAPPCPRPSR